MGQKGIQEVFRLSFWLYLVSTDLDLLLLQMGQWKGLILLFRTNMYLPQHHQDYVSRVSRARHVQYCSVVLNHASFFKQCILLIMSFCRSALLNPPPLHFEKVCDMSPRSSSHWQPELEDGSSTQPEDVKCCRGRPPSSEHKKQYVILRFDT